MPDRGSYAKGVAKREEILATALKIVAEHGFSRASVSEISEAVGLSRAGLFHYFTSREDLFTAIVRARDEADEATLIAAARGDVPDLSWFPQLVRHNSTVPGLVQLYANMAIEAAAPDHPSHEFFADRLQRFRQYAAESVRNAQIAGTVDPELDPNQLATMLLIVSDGLQAQWLMDPTIDMGDLAEAYIETLSCSDRARGRRPGVEPV